jgi:hypothetical protein
MVRGRIRPLGPDLFSSASLREGPSPGAKPPRQAPSNKEFPAAASSPHYLLPKDLSNGIELLTDQEFDRLLAAVLTEQKRRRKRLLVSRKASRKPPVQGPGPTLAPAKSTLYGLPSRQVSLHPVLPVSLEFPTRMFERRWQVVIRLSVRPMRSRGIRGHGGAWDSLKGCERPDAPSAPMRSRSVASSVGLILTHSEPSDCLFRSRLDPIP